MGTNAAKSFVLVVLTSIILSGCGRRTGLSVISKQVLPTPVPTLTPTPTSVPIPTVTPTPTPTFLPPPWIPSPTPVPTQAPVVVVPAPSIPALKCTLEAASAPRADMSLPLVLKTNLPLQAIQLNKVSKAANEALVLTPTGNQYVGVADILSTDGQRASCGFVDTVPFFCNLQIMEVKQADGARNGHIVVRMNHNAQAGTSLVINGAAQPSTGPGLVDFRFTSLPQGSHTFEGRFGGTVCAATVTAVVPGNYFELYALTASRVYQNETPDKAIDGETTTYWGSGDYTGSITLCAKEGIVLPSRIDIRWSQSPADDRSREFEFSHSVAENMSDRTAFNKRDTTRNESITTIVFDRAKGMRCFKIDHKNRFASWIGIREVIAYR